MNHFNTYKLRSNDAFVIEAESNAAVECNRPGCFEYIAPVAAVEPTSPVIGWNEWDWGDRTALGAALVSVGFALEHLVHLFA